METKTKDKVDIPDGTYNGSWTGYEVVIEGFKNIVVKTEDGIRGINIPCKIKVKNKEARIISLM